MADALTLRVRMSDALTLRVRKADGMVCVVRSDLCTDMRRPGAEYLASLHPECPERLLRPDAAPASGCRIFFLMSGQSRSDGNVELVRFFDSHEGDGVRAVFAGVQLLYRNNTPHDNPSKFAHH